MASQMYLCTIFTISLVLFTINFANCAPTDEINTELNSNNDEKTDLSKLKVHHGKNFNKKRDYPSEGILLGKREYPSEGILLGKREFSSEGILFGKREYPSEGILLGKREYPQEGILLGKREYPQEGILLGKREYPHEGILLGKRFPTDGILLGRRNFHFNAPKSSAMDNNQFNN